MKKALIFALSLVLVCSLTACGEPDNKAGNTSTDPASTSTPEPTDTISQPEEAGDTSEPEEASTPVEEPTDTGEPAEPEDTPEPADTTSQPQGSSTSGTGASTPTEVNTPDPAPTPQQSGDTYEDDPDIDLEVNPRYEYDLNELLDYGYHTYEESNVFDWQTGEWIQ